jgi:D-serine deaminase-like pyridoxal phosphate-dependent protein
MNLKPINTPAALIDLGVMQHNIERMQTKVSALGASFRPHVKTSKCVEVTLLQVQAGAKGVTVSTLKEAEQFFAAGIVDILYAVGMVGNKLAQAHALIKAGCDLKILTDSVASAQAIIDYARLHHISFKVFIEIDTDDHRSGIKPESEQLLAVARTLSQAGAVIAGVMTHAGSSYDLNTEAALVAMAEQERALCVLAATRIREAGFACPAVSVGSTPTALSARSLEGVTEVRAGVYVFFDLVMHNVGVCTLKEIALSVVTTVIGHQAEKGWAIVDAGWMAMSRDRGTQKQTQDFGYGQVCTLAGEVLPGLVVSGANQEHGIISKAETPIIDVVTRFPIGTQLRILPNHACATGAQFPEYQVIDSTGNVKTWSRFYGW